MVEQEEKEQVDPISLLATLNELLIKAFSCRSKKNLGFVILNDTVSLIKYGRAVLVDLCDPHHSLLGVSGQAKHTKESKTLQMIQALSRDLVSPNQLQKIEGRSFKKKKLYEKYQEEAGNTEVLWVPIVFEEELLVGLWLERWEQKRWKKDEMSLLSHLARGYGAAWNRYTPFIRLPSLSKPMLLLLTGLMLIGLFEVPIPLRMVAPCEVAARDPYLVTAPLNGIIEEMKVKPGQGVDQGDLLFVYDKRVPLQELKVAKKQVDIAESQLRRVMTQGVRDPKALNETAVWQLELEKEKIKLELAEFQASQLEVKANVTGITSFDNPDDWRGKPVQIGERVMLITNPEETKVTIWLAEEDSIDIDMEREIKVFLDVDPGTTYRAKLAYVAEYSEISEKGVPSFNAEADWIDVPKNARIGVKGTAILYGENVSLFYFLMRKPWNTVRRFLGW